MLRCIFTVHHVQKLRNPSWSVRHRPGHAHAVAVGDAVWHASELCNTTSLLLLIQHLLLSTCIQFSSCLSLNFLPQRNTELGDTPLTFSFPAS